MLEIYQGDDEPVTKTLITPRLDLLEPCTGIFNGAEAGVGWIDRLFRVGELQDFDRTTG